MAIYGNEHAVVLTRDDDIRYQLTTFRDATDGEGGTEAICMGSATVGELLKVIRRLSEIIIANGVEAFAEEFGKELDDDGEKYVDIVAALAVRRALARKVLDAAACGCGLNPKKLEVKSWAMK